MASLSGLLDSWRDSEKKRRKKRNEIEVVSDVVYLGTQRRNGEVLERKGYMDSMEMLRTKNDAFFIGGK